MAVSQVPGGSLRLRLYLLLNAWSTWVPETYAGQSPKIGSQLTPRILCGRTVDRSPSRALCAAQAGHWPEHGDRWGRVTVRLSADG